MSELTNTLARLLLSTSARQRETTAVVQSSFKVPTECELAQRLDKCKQSYHEAVKGMQAAGKPQEEIETTLGAPATHVFNGLVTFYLEKANDLPAEQTHEA